MTLTLAELAAEATDLGELTLAKMLVDAMTEASRRSIDLSEPLAP